jgi:hypothetical protein
VINGTKAQWRNGSMAGRKEWERARGGEVPGLGQDIQKVADDDVQGREIQDARLLKKNRVPETGLNSSAIVSEKSRRHMSNMNLASVRYSVTTVQAMRRHLPAFPH